MSNTVKIRAKVDGSETIVKALFKHPMETGNRKDSESGELVPIDFIKEVTVEHNGEAVFSAEWGTGVAKNPYLSFKFEGGKSGDEISFKWLDDKGESFSETAKIK